MTTTRLETIGSTEAYVTEGEDFISRISLIQVQRAQDVASGQVRTERSTAGFLSPPYDPNWLATLPERSSILPQCIAALSAGKVGFGYSLDPVGFDPKTLEKGAEQLVEKERIRRWFDFAAGDLSWSDHLDRSSRDEETVGWYVWELLEDKDTLVGMSHMQGRTVRLMPTEEEAIDVQRFRLSEDGSKWEETTERRNVRTYVQLGANNQKAYFREVGDPRAISRATGKVLGPKVDPTNPGHARQLIFTGPYNPAGEYPLPRWIGSIGSIGNSFAAEQRNLSWFKNPLPILMLLVSGGLLGKEAHEYIAQKLLEARNDDKTPSVVIVEAKTKETSGGKLSDVLNPGAALTPNMEIVKLNELSPKDGQFQDLDGNSRDHVRSACGVPPIFTAETQDYSRATAAAALQVAEQGTFAPARRMQDTIINRHIMPRIDAKWWTYRGNGPALTSLEDVERAAEAMTKMGSGSPNFGAELMSKALGAEVPKTDQPWGDLPFALVQVLANQGLLEVMQESRLERSVAKVVDAMLVKAAEGWDAGRGCCEED